ncbi:unnamed protein product [Sympodiomycopsis kandeliae]
MTTLISITSGTNFRFKAKKTVRDLKAKFKKQAGVKGPQPASSSSHETFLAWLCKQRTAVYRTVVYDHGWAYDVSRGQQQVGVMRDSKLSSTRVTVQQERRLQLLGIQVNEVSAHESANTDVGKAKVDSIGQLVDACMPFPTADESNTAIQTPLLSLDPFSMVIPIRPRCADEDMFNTLFGLAGLDITNCILWHWSRSVHASATSSKQVQEVYAASRKLLSTGDYNIWSSCRPDCRSLMAWHCWRPTWHFTTLRMPLYKARETYSALHLLEEFGLLLSGPDLNVGPGPKNEDQMTARIAVLHNVFWSTSTYGMRIGGTKETFPSVLEHAPATIE